MRRKNGLSALIVLSFSLFFVQSASAQDDREYRGPETERPVRKGFASKLWYGGSIGLNYYGVSGGGSVFSIGLAPMVGYKIIEPISVGPRVSFAFNSLKYPGLKAVGLFDTEAGIFVRGRIYKGFFLQGELSNTWTQQPGNEVVNNRPTKFTEQRFNQYLGAGYNFGNGQGGGGSEISIHYNFAIANDLETYENPLQYRFSFTYGF